MPRTNAHRACDDFRSTSESVRRSYLGEGGGVTRRQVIGRGLAAGLTVYAAKAMSIGRVFEAAEAAYASAPNAPVLVSVFLPGGCDLLDTIVPLDQYGRYAGMRPQLKQTNAAKLGSTGLGMNAALTSGMNGGVKGLFDAGKIGLMPGIDYSNPDLSHFHSRHFWETGLVIDKGASGWLGRLLDRTGSQDNPLQGVSMTGALSPVLRTGQAPVAAVSSPGDKQFWIPGVYGKPFDDAMAAWEQMAGRPTSGPGAAATMSSVVQAKRVADMLAPYRNDGSGANPLAGTIAYPSATANPLAGNLRDLAALLAQPLGIRVAAVESDGDFDTHDQQGQDLTAGLTQVSEALSAFQADLEARGIADRVLTLVWSEFGRRPHENDSHGTDHGAGGVAWLQGTRVRSGLLSDYPDLGKLDGESNLAVTLDFRRLYCSLLEQWMGADAASVIPGAGAFGRIQVTA